MKRSWVVLVLSLFIVTSLYAVPFTAAVSYSPHEQSITSFSETLPNDVLYYPDAWMNTTEGTATSGDDDYADSIILDSVYWETEHDEIANFQYFDNFEDNVTVEAFTYHCYGKEGEDSSGNCVLEYYDRVVDDWVTLETFTTSDAWYNDTVYISGLYEPNIVGLQINTYDYDTDIKIDYLSVNITYLTVDNSEKPATSGDDDYADSKILDGVYWETEVFEEATFDNNVGTNMQGFIYHCYGKESSDVGTILEYHDGDDWVTLETFTTSDAWYNDTVYIYLSEVRLRISTDLHDVWVQVDYLSVTILYPTFGESFTDVSDWAFDSESAGLPSESFTTDDDVLTFEIGYDDASNEWAKYDTPVTVSDTDYLEIRFICSTTLGSYKTTALSVYLDGTLIGERVMLTDWTTLKYLLSDYITGDQSELTLMIDDWGNGHASDAGYVKLDYVRIEPSTKMGLGHDASTTQGISSSDGGTIESDGDLTTLTADGNGSSFIIVADTTTTATAIATKYYPMFGIEIDSGFNFWGLEQYDGSAYATLQTSTLIVGGIYRFNMESLDTYVESWRINLTANAILVWDWAKAYSIANWSYYSSTGTVNDVFYVDSHELVSDKSGPAYIRWTYDPVLSVDTSTYNLLNITTGTWTGAGDYSYGSDYDVGSGWEGYTTDESNYTLEIGTLEALRIIIRDSGIISALSFLTIDPEWHEIDEIELWFDVAGWNIIDTIILVFVVELATYSLNLLLLFLGLAMIPLSTVYLVHGGRSEMSMDKIFYGVVVFIFGWALFLGGIFV